MLPARQAGSRLSMNKFYSCTSFAKAHIIDSYIVVFLLVYNTGLKIAFLKTANNYLANY